MELLPGEIQRKIMCLLDPGTVIALSNTCKTISSLNFSRYMIPMGLEGLFSARESPTLRERKGLQRIMLESYASINTLFDIPPFVSYCKEMSCETDSMLGCRGGNRYFRPSFYNIQNRYVHLSRRYVTMETLCPRLALPRRVRIASDDFMYGYLF